MKRTVRFTLNSRKFGSQTTVEGVHVGDDNSCELIITVNDGNKILDLSGETTVATMCSTKPDGTVISRPCSIVNNNIVYTLEKQDTAVSGNVLYQVKIASDNGISQSIIATAKFTVAVMKNIYIPIYRVLKSEPSDWSTNYTAYYRLLNNRYVAITDSSCPTFLKDTFYNLVNPNYDSENNYEAFQSYLVRTENLIGRASDILTILDNKINDVEAEHIRDKVSTIDFQNASKTKYPSVSGLYNYHTNYVEPCYDDIENLEENKADKATVDTALAEKLNNAAGAVTTDNIANKAVTSDKIANGAITALKIANGAVSGSNIAQNQISTNHLQSGAITNDKLDDELKISINGKADKSTTYTKTEVDEKSNNNVQEQINMLPKFLDMPVKVTSRALCVDGTSLYHSGTASYTVGGVKHMYATSKIDVSTETNPTFIGKLGGHDKCYPRNIAIGNGYLYVPYRDSKSGELSSFDTDTDIGGYLDIIRLSDFTLEENSITYSREPYKITTVVDGVEKEVERYFGKSHFVATYNDSLLCVTQQMGGWKLYDISTTPENPTLLYSYDNRADIYIDNADKGGYADFQQPAFFADTNGNIYLAISGYDRDLLMIYDLSDPFNPQEVFGFHCGNNQLNLRTVPEGGILTTPYIHTLGLACAYPYIYCTIAPHPNYLNDTENAFEGVIVADVSDITNVTTTVFKMPNDDRAEYDTGEPSPTSIAVNSRHLIMDNADKGISVWSLKNSAEPKYLGCLNTGTPVCSVCMTEDGRTFAGTAVGTKYIGMDSSISMYRGL